METTTYDPYALLPQTYVGARLDQLGVTLVNHISPIDGSEIACVDWQQMRVVFREHDRLMTDVIAERARPILIPDGMLPAARTETVSLAFDKDPRGRLATIFAAGAATGALIAAAASTVALTALGVFA